MSIRRPKNIREGLMHTVALSQTRPLRLVLCIVNTLIALNLITFGAESSYGFLLKSIPMDPDLAKWCWVTAFLVHAFTLLIGISGKYSRLTMMFEGYFGWCLWTWSALVSWSIAGIPTVLSAGLIAMTWILVRYPTHWKSWNPDWDKDDIMPTGNDELFIVPSSREKYFDGQGLEADE